MFIDEDHYVEHEEQKGVQCNAQGGITTIDLNFLQLQGQKPFVPPEIRMLSSLRELALHECGLSGSLEELLSPQLYDIPRLHRIHLAKNSLTGTIPNQIWHMENLTNLQLYMLPSGKTLSGGSLPHTLPPKLSSLELIHTGMTGSLPSTLGLLSDLYYHDMAKNAVTGSLPTEIGMLSRLDSMYL